MPLQPIPFNGPAYETKVTDQNAQQCINWYPVEDTQGGKHKGVDGSGPVLYPTPGLKSPFTTLAAGSVVRGMMEHRGLLYAVAANKFYDINTAGTATERGTLNTSSGRVNIAAISDEIVLVDGTNGYSYIPSTNNFATISDADYPDTATQITSQDTYFIVEDPGNEGRFYVSDANDGRSWATAAFATMDSYGDRLQTLISNKRELYLIGERSAEVWINNAEPSIVFTRRDGVLLDLGTSAKDTVVKADNSLYWLAQDDAGNHIVTRLEGFNPKIVSTRALSYHISTYTTITDAYAFAYRQEGHEFYVLTFPTEERTWVYDTTTGLWHERRSLESSNQNRWRANCHAYFNGKNYVGDYNSGKIYELDPSTYTDNGVAITRTRTTAPLFYNSYNFSVNQLQIDFESGVGADDTVTMSLSKDGGNTFVTGINRTIDTSETGSRVIWNRLGQAREMVFKLTTTANARIIPLGALADIKVGSY